MQVKLDSISKRYAYSWIIRDFTQNFPENTITGISGPNGSGKSTLMKMLSTYLLPSTGEIEYSINKKRIPQDKVYKHISFVAPYTDIVREFTLKEIFDFHGSFVKWRQNIDFSQFKDILQLPSQKGKQIQYFSSGMNQRLQLALSILSDTPLLLLDEPTSYLDGSAKQWTFDLLSKHVENRTLIIASNDADDFKLSQKVIELK